MRVCWDHPHFDDIMPLLNRFQELRGTVLHWSPLKEGYLRQQKEDYLRQEYWTIVFATASIWGISRNSFSTVSGKVFVLKRQNWKMLNQKAMFWNFVVWIKKDKTTTRRTFTITKTKLCILMVVPKNQMWKWMVKCILW